MTKKSKKKKAAVGTDDPRQLKASTYATGAEDVHVVRALTQALEAMYVSCSGDTAASIRADIEFMREHQCCCFASIEETVTTNRVAGIFGGHWADAAVEAYGILTQDVAYMSMQGNQKQPPSARKETMCTGSSEKLQQTTTISGKNDKPQTVAECNKLTLESTKPLQARGQVVKIGEASDKLMQQALAKAKAEMKQNFCFESLCAQGQQLYHLVLQDKTRRFYSKLKHRSKWKLKKKGSLSPDN